MKVKRALITTTMRQGGAYRPELLLDGGKMGRMVHRTNCPRIARGDLLLSDRDDRDSGYRLRFYHADFGHVFSNASP
jgi:hypothetical protein